MPLLIGIMSSEEENDENFCRSRQTVAAASPHTGNSFRAYRKVLTDIYLPGIKWRASATLCNQQELLVVANPIRLEL